MHMRFPTNFPFEKASVQQPFVLLFVLSFLLFLFLFFSFATILGKASPHSLPRDGLSEISSDLEHWPGGGIKTTNIYLRRYSGHEESGATWPAGKIAGEPGGQGPKKKLSTILYF